MVLQTSLKSGWWKVRQRSPVGLPLLVKVVQGCFVEVLTPALRKHAAQSPARCILLRQHHRSQNQFWCPLNNQVFHRRNILLQQPIYSQACYLSNAERGFLAPAGFGAS